LSIAESGRVASAFGCFYKLIWNTPAATYRVQLLNGDQAAKSQAVTILSLLGLMFALFSGETLTSKG
jgi:hypothetical protein